MRSGFLLGRLVLLLLASTADGRFAGGLLMHDELGVAVLLVPLESREVGVLELVICLSGRGWSVKRHFTGKEGS